MASTCRIRYLVFPLNIDILQKLFEKLKTVVCRPILYHGFPIQSKSIEKLLRQKITVTTLKLFYHKEFTFYHEKEGRGLTSSTSPYHAETNYINDKCRPRSSGNVTETRFCRIFIYWKIPKIKKNTFWLYHS